MLYIQISPSEDVAYDFYRVTQSDISSFAVDNTGWAQVLISLDKLGFTGSGVQNLRVISVYTEFWSQPPVTLLLDEIKFLPTYTRVTTDAVSGSVHMYNGEEECDGTEMASASSVSFVGMMTFGLVILAL